MLTKPISCHWSLSNPLKTAENLWFSGVFRRDRKRPVTLNGLKMPCTLLVDAPEAAVRICFSNKVLLLLTLFNVEIKKF